MEQWVGEIPVGRARKFRLLVVLRNGLTQCGHAGKRAADAEEAFGKEKYVR